MGNAQVGGRDRRNEIQQYEQSLSKERNDMAGMINGYPTEEELRNRITNQLARRGPSNPVALIWHGYLSALLEWGVIEVNVFARLTELLPKVGSKELYELLLDEKLSDEQEHEIEDSPDDAEGN